MRYTCYTALQKNDSIVYFRVPGDQVSCAYNIVLDGIINLDVYENGEFLLLETSLGTISGNFKKIISNVPVVLHVNKRNVTVSVNSIVNSTLTFTSSIVIIVSSIVIFLLVMFIIWYKITNISNHKITSTSNHEVTSTKNRDKISEILGPPPKMKYSRNPLMFDNL